MRLGIEHEQRQLHMVRKKLTEALSEIDSTLAEKETEIRSMKKYFFDYMSEFDEFHFEETFHRQMIDNELDDCETRLRKKQTYIRLLHSAYFGRVDFCFTDETEPESFRIGFAGFQPARNAPGLIYDWRAPIAGLYYDYAADAISEGAETTAAPIVSYEAPGGSVTGVVMGRAQYKIIDERLVYLLEDEMKIDDEILQYELSRHTDTTLKNIVATIQREQNAIIRNKQDSVLIVQGSAGSGKTSVALHRIAYLLYANRGRLRSENVLILSPNTIFSDYISHILPELGEDNILEMSFDELAARELSGLVGFERRSQYLESVLQKSYSKRPSAYLEKQSLAFADALEVYVTEALPDLLQFQDLSYRGITCDAAQLRHYFLNKLHNLPLLARNKQIADYLVSDAESAKKRDMGTQIREELTERLDRCFPTTSLVALYDAFLFWYAAKAKGTDHEPEAAAAALKSLESTRTFFAYEDVYPFLYFKYLLCGNQTFPGVKHLVVDEMQDYSPMQYRLIKRLFHCDCTILGDTAQVFVPDEADLLSLLRTLFGETAHIVRLEKSYRSTKEISEFAAGVLGRTTGSFFERHGQAPSYHAAADYEAMCSQLLSDLLAADSADASLPSEALNEAGTAAILCKTAGQAQRLFEQLCQLTGQQPGGVNKTELPLSSGTTLYLKTKEDGVLEQGILLLPSYLAKGLEFDAVYLPEVTAAQYATPTDRQALYISCTRALHQLYLYGYGTRSPLLPDEELYL